MGYNIIINNFLSVYSSINHKSWSGATVCRIYLGSWWQYYLPKLCFTQQNHFDITKNDAGYVFWCPELSLVDPFRARWHERRDFGSLQVLSILSMPRFGQWWSKSSKDLFPPDQISQQMVCFLWLWPLLSQWFSLCLVPLRTKKT